MAAGLRGAFLLARGHAAGLALIEATPQGAARSFRAGAICLPVFLALRLLSWGTTGGAPAGGVATALTAEVIGFVAAWAGFALASLYMAEASGRRTRWPHFVAAWNFTNVVQYVALLAAALLALGLPAWLGNGLALAAVGYALWLEWFVVRAALGLAPIRAAGFVAVDLAIGLFVSGLVARLS